MKMNQVIHKCNEEGYPISKMGVYLAGRKNGFIVKCEGQKSLIFNQEKFLEWLKKAKEEVPEGFISIKQCKERLHKSIAALYSYVRDNDKVETKYIGSGKGILYVNFEQLERFIKEREFGTEEKFGN